MCVSFIEDQWGVSALSSSEFAENLVRDNLWGKKRRKRCKLRPLRRLGRLVLDH